jgi:hypothetical protein
MIQKPNFRFKFPLLRVGFFFAALLTFTIKDADAQGDTRPATIAGGSDSVAAQLHYPPKAKETRRQAAIPFYCEVDANGKADHLQLYGPTDAAEFRLALQRALRAGRFQPAMSEGKAVAVIIGGTAFFLFDGNHPTIAIALSTADKDKTAALSNYLQPQMIGTSAEFRRKIWKSQWDADLHIRGHALHPGAMVLAQVDGQGNLVNTKITGESPPDCGWGPLLVKGFKDAKFIPALSNGKPVAGTFDYMANYDSMSNPDYGAPTGSNIKRDDYDR